MGSLISGELENGEAFSDIVTASRKMHSLFQYVEAVAGSGEPHGHTVTQPQPSGSTAVTFNATPATPDSGTPSRPNTGTRNGTPAASGRTSPARKASR